MKRLAIQDPIDQLRTLKLDGMADAFIELQAQDKARDLAHAEWLALLLDREAASRSRGPRMLLWTIAGPSVATAGRWRSRYN